MKSLIPISLGCVLSLTSILWSQVDSTTPAPAVTGQISGGQSNGDDTMLTPPPVSNSDFPALFSAEARSNYLRGGVNFTAAYSDNILGGSSVAPVSDVSYSIWPNIEIDQVRARTSWSLAYAPGFTFYQKTDARNETDQNLAANFSYRLSPHVTVSLKDAFQKSSSFFNQPGEGLGVTVSGSTQGANNSVIAPLADRLGNVGSAEITYQFGPNGMVGASGVFSNLHYSDPTQVQGLFDSSTQGGSAFYSLRLSRKHYVGATYQYQRLLSYAPVTNETETQSILLFYSFYPSPALSFSFFGGPEHYSAGPQFISVNQPLLAAAKAWSPGVGASVNWQSQHTAVALSYSRVISGGGGLSGAVQLDSASVSLRQQITRQFSGSLVGTYGNNALLISNDQVGGGGHSISAGAGLQRQVGEHFSVDLGYLRLHQSYSTVAAITGNPDTNREWVSISYKFTRPLGR
jgi:hypothetical protein